MDGSVVPRSSSCIIEDNIQDVNRILDRTMDISSSLIELKSMILKYLSTMISVHGT